MIIYLVGVSCVGKTTIGELLAKRLKYDFYDLDHEVEKFYQTSIERIRNSSFGSADFVEKISLVLKSLILKSENSVIAGTPSGLKYSNWKVIKNMKKKKEIVTIHIVDLPENIVNRLTFYDIDSNPIEVEIDDNLRKKYIKSIKSDYNFYRNTFERADLEIDIANVSLPEIPELIINELQKRV